MNKRVLPYVFALLAVLSIGACEAWVGTANISNRSDYACVPRAVHDSSNNLHMVWYGGPDTAEWKIYYQKCDGSSWSSPAAISANPAAYPAITIDGSNNLHVVWHQGSNPEEIYYRKCTNGVWGTPVNLSNSTARSLNPKVSVDASGNNVLVSWHENAMNSGNWDIVAKKCTGGTWGSIENVSNDSTLSRNVDSACDLSGNFHLVWEDTDTSYINYKKRLASGTWGATVRLDSGSSTAKSWNAAVCVAPNGFVHTAWHDNITGDYEIYHRYWNGYTWSSAFNVSTQPAVTDCFVSLAADQNNDVQIAWGDYDSIYYRHQRSGAWKPLYKIYTSKSKIPYVDIDGSNRCHLLWMDNNTGWNVMYNRQDLPDALHPGAVLNLAAYPTDGQIKLSWQNPSSLDFAGTMIRWKLGSYPIDQTDGTLLCNRAAVSGSLDSFDHKPLSNGETYYYSAFAYDIDSNYAPASRITGSPVPPPKSNLLSGGLMDSFTGGVADGWTAYRVNDPAGAVAFSSDASYSYAGSSQVISGIDGASLPASGLSTAGVYQKVSGTTPGRVYQLVGYLDIFNTNYTAAGHRYLHNFGINPTGATDPGTPAADGTVGGCRWMAPSQAFWNDSSGSNVSFHGFDRACAAFPATGTSVSVWAGLTWDNAAARDSVATRYYADNCFLFEWDFPARASLANGSFEGEKLDLQDGGDVIPAGWIPCGGGIGQWNAWVCDTSSKLNGDYGVEIANRRGVVFAGLMQKVACTPGGTYTFSAWSKASGQDNTVAAVGIDPRGGGDITSPGIIWQSTTSSAWVPLTVSAAAQGSAVTVFIRTSNSNGAGSDYHKSYFDDCSITGPAIPEARGISQVKELPDGAAVTVAEGIVTAVYDGFFYIEKSDRTGGIRVESADPASVGEAVTVTGMMGTTPDQERYISNAVILR